MIMETVVICTEPECLMPLHTRFFPLIKPLHLGTRFHKKLHLHLFELTHTEDKLAGYDLISERFSYLCDTERQLHATGLLHIEIVYEDTLCRFRTQINPISTLRSGAHFGGKHEVELPHIRPILRTGDRINDAFIENYLLQLLQIGTLHSLGIAFMQCIALLLMLCHARIGGTKFRLIKCFSEAFTGL